MDEQPDGDEIGLMYEGIKQIMHSRERRLPRLRPNAMRELHEFYRYSSMQLDQTIKQLARVNHGRKFDRLISQGCSLQRSVQVEQRRLVGVRKLV
jgi:hypothetical protein